MSEMLISHNIDPYHNDPSKLYLGYLEPDYKKPWAKYFNPNVALISDEVQKGLICSPWASPLGANIPTTQVLLQDQGSNLKRERLRTVRSS